MAMVDVQVPVTYATLQCCLGATALAAPLSELVLISACPSSACSPSHTLKKITIATMSQQQGQFSQYAPLKCPPSPTTAAARWAALQ